MGRADKVRIPHAGKSAKRDQMGKPDWPQARAIIQGVLPQFDSGHYTLDNIGQVDTANKSRDDEKDLMQAMRGLKPNQRLLWFVRGEADPATPAKDMSEAAPAAEHHGAE